MGGGGLWTCADVKRWGGGTSPMNLRTRRAFVRFLAPSGEYTPAAATPWASYNTLVISWPQLTALTACRVKNTLRELRARGSRLRGGWTRVAFWLEKVVSSQTHTAKAKFSFGGKESRFVVKHQNLSNQNSIFMIGLAGGSSLLLSVSAFT